MAVSDTSSDSLRLRCTDTVPADADVKHVDQLDDSVYRTITRAANGNAHELDASATELTAGDVVVFTDYLQIERT